MKMLIEDQTNIQHYSLLESLPRFTEIQERINRSADAEVIFDLGRVRYAFPLFLNLLLILRDKSDKKVRFVNTTSYLSTIEYPKSVPFEQIELFERSKKTYLPLVAGSPEAIRRSQKSLAHIMATKVADLLSIRPQIKSGISYMLQEIIDNVDQHANATSLYAAIQAYPANGFVDICIADNGEGIKASYQRAGLEVETDMDAIINVASAYSSKDKPDNESRGYGLFTSRKISTQGLSGEFICMSGNAVYSKIREKELLLQVNELDVRGTVVALRIRYDNDKFNMYNYLEY